MKKIFFILFTLFFIFIKNFAQPKSNSVTNFNKAIQYKQKGLNAAAISSFKQAIALNKKYDSAYLQLSLLYAQMNQSDSAIVILNNAVTNNPSFALAYYTMGNIYRDMKQNYDYAIANYLNAIRIDSTHKESYYGLAWCSNVKKYYRDAIKYSIKALDIDNNYKPAYNEMGHAYRQLNAFQECIDQLKKNLAISKNEIPLLYSGYCYLELKNKEGALTIYEELKKINVKMAESLKKKIDTAK